MQGHLKSEWEMEVNTSTEGMKPGWEDSRNWFDHLTAAVVNLFGFRKVSVRMDVMNHPKSDVPLPVIQIKFREWNRVYGMLIDPSTFLSVAKKIMENYDVESDNEVVLVQRLSKTDGVFFPIPKWARQDFVMQVAVVGKKLLRIQAAAERIREQVLKKNEKEEEQTQTLH